MPSETPHAIPVAWSVFRQDSSLIWNFHVTSKEGVSEEGAKHLQDNIIISGFSFKFILFYFFKDCIYLF